MAQITPSPSSLAFGLSASEKSEYAKAWIPLMQAMAEGKTIQIKQFDLKSYDGSDKTGTYKWVDCTGFDAFTFRAVDYFRVKPEPKKARYRVALLKDGGGYWAKTINHEGYNFSDDKDVTFVHWLTDFIEYELPEGEA